MIYSMTGFSQVEKSYNSVDVKVEIRSYNSRYLDLQLRIPQSYQSFEEPIKALILEKISRGRIEFKLQILEKTEEACEFEINEPKASSYYRALLKLQQLFNLPNDIGVQHFLEVNGIIKPVDVEKNLDELFPIVKDCVQEAISNLNDMRKKEGDFLAVDLEKRLTYIENYINEIESQAVDLIFHYQQKLKDRIIALTQGIVEIDLNRIVQEAAILADRSDISEEITRARIHVNQFRTMIYTKEPSGRKLNFLVQELGREFNTIASKSNSACISHKVVEAKSELEKIREQVQNVE